MTTTLNQFATLDAQSEVCALATVASNEAIAEGFEPAAPVERFGRGKINYAKVALHNLGKPLDQRIESERLQEKLAFAPQRRKIMSLWFQIHQEVEPLRQSIRNRQNALESL